MLSKNTRQKHIISISFGKDSLAMLLSLVERGDPVDEAVFYDTGMEFQAIYDTRDSLLPYFEKHGITFTELKPAYSFTYKMFDKPVNGRKNGFHYGYSWCGGRCRWGTTDKLQALDKYAENQNAIMYVGIAADETKRLEKDRKPYKQFPLATWGFSEAKCLRICYKNGFEWLESGIRLYDILDRVSCWCCANKNLKELKGIYKHLPEYWEQLKGLQARTERPMKGAGKSVFELEERFKNESTKPITTPLKKSRGRTPKSTNTEAENPKGVKIMRYKTCESCGANLDPGERCECQSKLKLNKAEVETQKSQLHMPTLHSQSKSQKHSNKSSKYIKISKKPC